MRRIACVAVAPPPVEHDPRVDGALLDLALAHSPRVEESSPGLVYVDVAGLQALFGDDTELAERLRRRASELGLGVCVGIAGSRVAALAAARRGGGVTIVERGGDAAYLASASVS